MKDTERLEDERIDRVNENVTLIQKRDGLTFGTDAYLLYAYMKKQSDGVAADLGAGTGIISLLAASKNKYSHITAVELQPEFAEIIERNAALNGLSDRITVECADVRSYGSDKCGAFDSVFTNPPYMKAGCGRLNESEEKHIARHEINGGISDFCACASRLLKYGGLFYAVWRPERMCDILCAMREAGIEPKRMTFVCPDATRAPSLVLVEGKKNAASGLFVTKPLHMHKNASSLPLEDTDELKQIYESGDFGEQFRKR